ncbi:MAG: tRNA guanosine(34) transglycosylase Tgt [Candidatus Woesearchaeota archaeon]
MSFEIKYSEGDARVGLFKTKSGVVETPFFMPVVTKATGKHITTDDYSNLGEDLSARAMICNSLILSLRPGIDIISKAGGIHKFMNYKGVVFTDCGGFQSSSSFFERKSKKGLHFRSPYDNKRVILTPETIMNIQWLIDSDVAMMLDDMSGFGVSFEEAELAMENTHLWGIASLEYHKKLRSEHNKGDDNRQFLFGIVQGNFYPDLRRKSAEFLSRFDFDGFAIGGVAIGEPKEDMYLAVDSSLPYLSKDKIKYVMGLGSPVDLLEMIGRGIDCFDSIYPTQNARHSSIFTWSGKIYIDKGRYAEDFTPIEEGCKCHTCMTYTNAYLHHLTKIGEPSAHRLKSIHNQYFLQELMQRAKEKIKEKKFYEFKDEFIKNWLRQIKQV